MKYAYEFKEEKEEDTASKHSRHSRSSGLSSAPKPTNTTEFIMDFVTTITDEEKGTLDLNWYRINFRKDFGQYLELFKRLPYDSVEESMLAHRRKDIEMNAIVQVMSDQQLAHEVLKRNLEKEVEEEILENKEEWDDDPVFESNTRCTLF